MEEFGFEMNAGLHAAGAVRAATDSQRPVVIVDDNTDDQMELKRELEHLLGAMPVLTFQDGTALLRYLDAHPRESERPRLIFLDLNMVGMDGLMTLELLQGRLAMAGVPVVAVSGTRNAAQVTRAFESGAQAFLPKPVSRWDMIRVLHGKTTTDGSTYR